MLLSFLFKIKNRIRDTFKKRTRRPYEPIMNPECNVSDPQPHTDVGSPIHEPVTTLFHREIPSSHIIRDDELQTLLSIVRRADIEVDKLTLEPRIEEMIDGLPNMTPVIQMKLRLIYIIIALDIYRPLFCEMKRYHSVRSNRYFGVYRYNDYIIRMDDSPYSFINESDVINALTSSRDVTTDATTDATTEVVLPFLIYTNIRRNHRNRICECNPAIRACECKYNDDAANHPDMIKLNRDSLMCFNKMRKDAVSFSIQHYVKKTVPLYNWVKDQFTSYAYSQFSNIQYPFFIQLFYKCAKLLQTLHKAGVVHGDVKPDNILIFEQDTFDIHHPERCKHFKLYLIDFGLSGIHGKGYGTGGTIPYCHPDFKNILDTFRSNKYNWKTLQLKHDIWSLGLGFLTLYIYRDYYNYYYKYPNYFFTKSGFVSSLILDVIAHPKLNELFSKMMTEDCIPIDEVCASLDAMITSGV